MPVELTIPVVGESITEVQISEWLKSEGDLVKQDETIAIIDSEKATLDLPAPQNGRLVKILHQAGETVAVGAVVAHLEAVGEAGKSKSDETTSKPETRSADKSKPKTDKPESPEKSKVETIETESSKSGSAKKPAGESSKTEPKLISKTEIKTPALKPSSNREEEIVPMTMLRRTVARHLVEAQQTMAMLTTFNVVLCQSND